MECKAKKYKKQGKQTTECTREAEYGVLCRVHSKLVAGTPDGFSMNRIKRIHFEKCTDLELSVSAIQYLRKNGHPLPARKTNPYSYQRAALNFIAEHKKATAGQIVDHIMRTSKCSGMTGLKVGALMSQMLKQGLITRRLTTVRDEGRKVGSAVYELA
jgi:hypothetical protein